MGLLRCNLVRSVLCLCVIFGAVLLKQSRAGWLDKLVAYHRERFIKDVQETVEIDATILEDGSGAKPEELAVWDYPAVERLLSLLGASKSAAPVRRVLRRALRPSFAARRIFVPKSESWKLFPSLGKDHGNEIYYDFDSDGSGSSVSDEQEKVYNSTSKDDDDDVIIEVRNPIEARLPSARITVKLLRQILEGRAIAARQMPSTARTTIHWVTKNKTVTRPNKKKDDKGKQTESSDKPTASLPADSTYAATEPTTKSDETS